MRKGRNIKLIVLVVLIIALTVSSLGFSKELPRVAVIGFDSTAPGYIWHINSELSKAATDLMINALIKTKSFRVFERVKLDAILKEQDFQAYSGRVDPSTAVKIGKMLGVDSIVTGSVTSIIYKKSGGIKLGPVSLKKSSASVTVTVRAINVTTGEIVFSEVKKGTTSKSGVSIHLPVAGGLGLSSEITKVYINLGEDSGIKVGDEIKIFQEGEVILDPKTSEVLDRELDLIAQARIMTVKEKLSIALVTTKFSNADIMPTDIVEVIR